VTSQKEIQSLIADIDSILPRADARLPWSKPGDVAKERRVLERVRSYLVSLQQQNDVAAPQELSAPASSDQSEVTRQVVQAVAQEINYLRADLLQPLQIDLEALRQERESLMQEIRALESTRQHLDSFPQPHNYEQQMLEEFSQNLIRHCTQSLTQQLAHILTNWEARLASTESIAIANTSRSAAPNQFENVIPSPDRLDHLRQMQVQSDQMLTTLDTNQRAIFEALQRDLQSYQESLSQGLDKMHSLSTQGQMLLTAFLEHLTQQLGRVPSTIAAGVGQPSDLTPLIGTPPTSQTTPPATLLPPDALSGTEGTPIVLQPVEPLLDEPESSTATSQALDQSRITAQDSVLENPTPLDWESVEGVDSEQSGVEPDKDELNALIQMNLNAQDSLPFVEESGTPSRSDSQELDAWLSQLLGQATPDTASTARGTDEVAGTEEPEVTVQPDFRTDTRRHAIDELYETLFGTGSLPNPTQPDVSAAAQSDTSQADVDERNEDLFNADAINPLSDRVEDALFEGLADPATETVQIPPSVGSQGQREQTWESLFFEDAASAPSGETDLPREAQESSTAADSLFNRDSAVEQEDIKTIAALTDLFEEMGLSHALPNRESISMPTPQGQPSGEPTSDTDFQEATGIEDSYIPASPDEDLSPTTENLESGLEREIQLDPEILRLLQQDLDSFEWSSGQPREIEQQQDLPRDEFEPPSVVPRPEPETLQRPQFLMSNELLAEDWEEFSPYEWSEGNPMSRSLAESAGSNPPGAPLFDTDTFPGGASIHSAPGEISDNSTLAASESVESDFEPDLFPPETLELDQEHAIQITAASPEELAMPGEPTVLDDDPFVEMLWDEPIDSLTEEIAPSPESRLDSDVFPQPIRDSEHGEADSSMNAPTPSDEILSEEAPQESSLSSQDTTVSPPASDHEAIASSGQALDENHSSGNLSELPRADDSNPSEGLPHPETSNREQHNDERQQ
jgi:hypothetical protein